jgi:hypothetical protein
MCKFLMERRAVCAYTMYAARHTFNAADVTALTGFPHFFCS